MPKKDFSVKYEGDMWIVMAEGNKKPSSRHATQKEAWDLAKERAAKGKSTAVKYGKDGSVKEQRSYA
jgi:hypothetical protein